MKKLLFIILMVITSLSFADGGETKKSEPNATIEMTGYVFDKLTNETLVGVEVEIDNKTVYTDLDGKFTSIVYPGEYEIKTSYISYNNVSDTIKINQNNTEIVVLMNQE